MIQIQSKHVDFTNDVDTESQRVVNSIADASTEPDRYWIISHSETSPQSFTCGTDEAEYTSTAPAAIHEIPVQYQQRNGGITYHGPGQISWVWMIDYRRVRRMQDTHTRDFSVAKIMQTFRNILNLEFGENLIANPGDPGLYRVTGEKIMSFGVHVHKSRWIFIKVNLNLCVDLSVYQGVTICGVDNRPMGNLLQTFPTVSEQQALGQRIMTTLWDNIYESYQLQPWSDK